MNAIELHLPSQFVRTTVIQYVAFDADLYPAFGEMEIKRLARHLADCVTLLNGRAITARLFFCDLISKAFPRLRHAFPALSMMNLTNNDVVTSQQHQSFRHEMSLIAKNLHRVFDKHSIKKDGILDIERAKHFVLFYMMLVTDIFDGGRDKVYMDMLLRSEVDPLTHFDDETFKSFVLCVTTTQNDKEVEKSLVKDAFLLASMVRPIHLLNRRKLDRYVYMFSRARNDVARRLKGVLSRIKKNKIQNK